MKEYYSSKISWRIILSLIFLCSFSQVFSKNLSVGNYMYTVLSEEEKTVSLVSVVYMDERETSIEIPTPKDYTLIEIGKDVFAQRNRIKSVTIPATVKKIGANAFEGCTSLSEITVLENLEIIEDGAFNNCSSLKNFVFPQPLVSIGRNAFSRCGLENITFNDSLQTIGDSAFYNCPLEKIVFGESIISIGEYAFMNCKFENITLNESLQTIGNYAFSATNLISIDIPSSVEQIGDYAFARCSKLSSVKLSASLEKLGEGVFSRCPLSLTITLDPANPYFYTDGTALFNKAGTDLYAFGFEGDKAIIPDGVERIIGGTFYGRDTLVEVVIPASVKEIGNFAFTSCYNLKTVVCYAVTPPQLGLLAFNDDGEGKPLKCDFYVPYNSLQLYKEEWPYNEDHIFYIQEAGLENVTEWPNGSVYTVYSIDGNLRMQTPNAEDLLSLAKGIYIINGKKVLIR